MNIIIIYNSNQVIFDITYLFISIHLLIFLEVLKCLLIEISFNKL